MDQRPGFISVDDHVQEHPRVWTDRLSQARWGERIPQVRREAGGGERWVVDGRPSALAGVAAAGALMADRTGEPQRWNDVPAAAYDPRARLQAMDSAGIDYSVLYPTVAGLAGETFARLEDPDLELACVQAYNDWLIDEWATASDRFVPQCIVPVYPPTATAAEIRRAVARGHRGVVFPALPMLVRDVPHVNDAEYDVVWATCAELDVPLCLHAGAVPQLTLGIRETGSPVLAQALGRITRSAAAIYDVLNLLFSRILTRHPGLRVVFAESALGWSTLMFEMADYQFTCDHVDLEEGYPLKPSELFKRQCFFTGWYDPVADVAKHVGPDHILWAANLPQPNSSWPDCQAFIGRCFADVPDTDRQRILWGNAAELYRLPAQAAVSV